MSCGCSKIVKRGKHLAEGAVLLPLTVLGSRAPDDVVRERTETCRPCDQRTHRLGVGVCGDCGCPLVPKRKARKKTCPRWAR